MSTIILYVLIFVLVALITSDAGIKPSMFKYLNMLICSIFALALAFNFYETVGNMLLSKAILPQFAYSICFLAIFAISLGILWSIAQLITKEEMPFSPLVLRIVNISSSVLVCLILIGVIYVGLGLAPSSQSFPYAHFEKDAKIAPQDIDRYSKSALLSTDKMVASLFNVFSNGSLSGNKKFSDLHPDYLDAMYLNKVTAEDGAPILVGDKSISLASDLDQVIKKASVSLRDQDGNPVKPEAGQKNITLSLAFSKHKFENAGALNKEDGFTITTGQIRILCKKEDGSIFVAYPQGYLKSSLLLERKGITEKIAYKLSDFNEKGSLGITLLYEIPKDSEPYARAFRGNLIKELPKAVKKKTPKTTPEANTSTPSES